MIALQQSVLEQAAAESRAGQYVEAWGIAGSDLRARTFVRYHAGDLEGALAEARTGPRDAWLCATGTEIALSLHRGPAAEALLATATEIALALHRGASAESLLAGWRASAAPADEARIASAAAELAALRAAELGAASGIRRARWLSALAGALALAFLLRFARRAG